MIAKLSGKTAPPAPESMRKPMSDQTSHAAGGAEAADEEDRERDDEHALLAELVAEPPEQRRRHRGREREASQHSRGPRRGHAELAWSTGNAGTTIVCWSENAVPASVRTDERDVGVRARHRGARSAPEGP
jgi:hypothetical protein